MYAGNIVEYTSADQLYDNPLHPYTWGLLNSQVTGNAKSRGTLISIPGNPPDLREEMVGCPFAARCPYAEEKCFKEKPPLIEVEPGHLTACHFQTKSERLERKEGGQNG